MLPLGPDGGGFDVMGLVVPWFQVLNAAVSVGIAEAAIERTAAPATRTRYEHLGQTLADQPVSRATSRACGSRRTRRERCWTTRWPRSNPGAMTR